MKINVLGTEYEIIESSSSEDVGLEDVDGYCDYSIKKVIIGTFNLSDRSLKDLDGYKKQVIRHELLHAFLFECGLNANSWGRNEEIVDWIGIQFPKLLQMFKEADAM